MRAVIIGATGATGKYLVEKLLNDNHYQSVVIFVRKTIGISHSKLHEHIIDFSNIERYQHLIVGDVFFSCLGTTLKTAGTNEKQWKIDFEIPLKFAEIAKKNHFKSFVLVSAYGVSPNSKMFYPRMKGKLETHITALNFDQLIIFRPGALIRPNSDRPSERFMVTALHKINKIGLFKKFKPLGVNILAEKLAKAPKTLSSGVYIIELDTIFKF